MLIPKFTITNEILKNIALSEAARELIENAPLVPTFEKQFQTDALLRTIHHGTHIEGNDLTLNQTKKVLEGEAVTARARDIQEVINYRNVIDLLEAVAYKRGGYDLETVLDIQRTVVEKIVPPDKVGVLRQTQVIIKNQTTGEIILRPPDFSQVPQLVNDLMDYLNSPEAAQLHPILKAAIAHYELSAIHPFVEGNGRTARAYATCVLIKEGYDLKKFFSLEEHFDADPAAYYQALAKTDKTADDIYGRDLTPWLTYFTQVVAVELAKIKERVKKLSLDSRLKIKIGQQIALSERQMRIVEFITDREGATMAELRGILKMVSDDTILRDVKDLLEKGLLKKEGSTKAARYLLVSK